MSLHEYRRSGAVAMQQEPFYALLMAAMRQADTVNSAKLRAAFPEVWDELYERYHAPGGIIPTDPEYDERTNLVRRLQEGERILP